MAQEHLDQTEQILARMQARETETEQLHTEMERQLAEASATITKLVAERAASKRRSAELGENTDRNLERAQSNC